MSESGLSLASAVTEAYKRHWSYTNTFRTEISWTSGSSFGNIGEGELGWSDSVNNSFNLNVVKVDIPQLSAQMLETYTADRWKIALGKQECPKFTITVRDEDYLKYHRMFSKLFLLEKKLYFDDYKMTVRIYKLPDYLNESEELVYEFDGCLLESVGPISFDTTADTNIAEFSVDFKSIGMAVADVK